MYKIEIVRIAAFAAQLAVAKEQVEEERTCQESALVKLTELSPEAISKIKKQPPTSP